MIVVAMIVGSLVTLMTVVAFFGSSWWFFDLLANYRWQLMWIALLCAIVYALSAKGLATIAFMAAVVVNAFVISPLYFGSQPAGTGENGVTVVSLDMHGSTTDEERVLDWLYDTDAEIIIASGVSADRLLPLTVDGSPYRFIANPDPDTTGVSIIAKADYAVGVQRTASGEPVYIVSVPSGGDVVSLVTAWSEVASSATAADALADRLAVIADIVDGRATPVVVIGPLGATRFTSGMRSLLATSGLRDATEGYGYRATSPVSNIPVIGGWIGIPIDVALMTAEITPLDLSTGPDVGVGHLPVSVTIGPTDTG